PPAAKQVALIVIVLVVLVLQQGLDFLQGGVPLVAFRRRSAAACLGLPKRGRGLSLKVQHEKPLFPDRFQVTAPGGRQSQTMEKTLGQ
ncbi:MAG TPA: hypothetical protein VLR44_04845, partial [Rhodoferax sp.]|nr:hypothetical protein [Rhodoferax sp.]